MPDLKADDLDIQWLDRSHEEAVRALFLEGLSDPFMFNGACGAEPESLLQVALAPLDGGAAFLMGGFWDGALVGVVPCFIRGNGKTLEMHLHLAKAFRGRSIASGFIRRVAQDLKAEGFNCFIWGPADHLVAKTVYLNAGFREVAILPGLWDLGGGRRGDVAVAVWGGV